MSFVVIIPARYASTRLPGKPLVDINGKPMIVHVLERARESGADRVIVATDHPDVARAVEAAGGEVCMTRADHQSGTERLAEVVEKCGFSDDTVIVNVQGDEPLIDPALINELAGVLHAAQHAAIATCATPIMSAETLFNPNIVKVVIDQSGHAMYFSRAPIPWHRDALAGGGRVLAAGLPALHHIGMYAYRATFLRRFPSLSIGRLEQVESLEQLRAMVHGYRIMVHVTPTHPGAGVDTPEDLERVRLVFAQAKPSSP